MARPVNPDSGFKVKIHHNGGHNYASTQPAIVDPVTGKKKYHHIHWGTVDENKRFHPDYKYLATPIEERSKLIFPPDWDLSEIEKLSGNRKPGRPVIESQDENRLYGDIWLLEHIADATGIRDDLMEVFNNDREKVNAILTLAYFPMSGKGTYSHLAAWQRISKSPCDMELNPTAITYLTQSITESDRMELLRLRAKRLQKNELCAVDSTSRSAWGDGATVLRISHTVKIKSIFRCRRHWRLSYIHSMAICRFITALLLEIHRIPEALKQSCVTWIRLASKTSF